MFSQERWQQYVGWGIQFNKTAACKQGISRQQQKHGFNFNDIFGNSFNTKYMFYVSQT